MTSDGNLILTADNVETVFKDCFRDPYATLDENAVLIEGIVHKAYLDKDKLEEHRPEIEAWIRQLPSQFLKSGGGGWSFLNLCNDHRGEQWTGLHLTMEHLCMLAMGIDRAVFPLPHDVWSVLPGGMPYVIFDDGDK